MHGWLSAARSRLSAKVGDNPSAYELADADVVALLELARIAAHDSGDRTNAPLACYLVGLAHGRNPAASLAELAAEAVQT